jgi:hypothetical protein
MEKLSELQSAFKKPLYILGPGYFRTSQYKLSDFQIGCTGKFNKMYDKTTDDTVRREVVEELCLDVNITGCKKFTTTQMWNGVKCKFTHYVIPSSNCKQIFKKDVVKDNKKMDDITNRVAVWIFGSNEDILRCIFNSSIAGYNCEKNINYITGVKLDNAINVFNDVEYLESRGLQLGKKILFH